MKGIDISSHNGSINFNAVKNSGVEVVIIKSTEGVDFRDDYLDTHYWGAKNAGIPHIGFYHFMSERSNPSRQAEDFWDAIKDKQYDVKPCLDIETNNQGRSANQITDRCLEFINRFKEISGQDVMVYTGGYFGRDELDDRIKCYSGWIAHYGASEPMWTGFPVVGHQFTESGRISGVNTNCDVNNFNEGILLGNNYSGGVGGGSCASNSSDPVFDRAKAYNSARCLEIQQLLIRCGYDLPQYGADNCYGYETHNQLGNFQENHGLEKDFLCGDMTFAKLNEVANGGNNQQQPAPQPQPQGDGRVVELQRDVINPVFGVNIDCDGIWGNITDGYVRQLTPASLPNHTPELTRWVQLRLGCQVDSIFGQESYNAVIGWQSSHNLECDGIVGYNTIKSLCGL